MSSCYRTNPATVMCIVFPIHYVFSSVYDVIKCGPTYICVSIVDVVGSESELATSSKTGVHSKLLYYHIHA